MSMEGLATDETGPTTFHQLRGAADRFCYPYDGRHAPPMPPAALREAARLYELAAVEAERMQWPRFAAEMREYVAAALVKADEVEGTVNSDG